MSCAGAAGTSSSGPAAPPTATDAGPASAATAAASASVAPYYPSGRFATRTSCSVDMNRAIKARSFSARGDARRSLATFLRKATFGRTIPPVRGDARRPLARLARTLALPRPPMREADFVRAIPPVGVFSSRKLRDGYCVMGNFVV